MEHSYQQQPICKWDSSLAASAQNVANDCPESSLGDSLLGENIYSNYTEFSNALDDMGVETAKMWKSMFKDYKGTSIKMNEATLTSRTARATQMAWATTEFIGCGVKKCGSDPFLQVYKFSVVCHYREKGNILNSNIYEEGAACSACPILTLCEADSGLCV
ncbi:hypothetical protein B9Z55_015417 [Caenorhabditis nigoni]|nr:hypothetical protein B9Z55_015417 [Caenorhabditis nigoni]